MKFIRLLVFFFFMLMVFCSCSYEKGLILFNNEPVTKQNMLNDSKVFSEGRKIYYIFLAPKKLNTEFIRVQVFKITDLDTFGGSDVVRTKDVRVMKHERYYYTDYFVFHEKGRYVMQVFSHNDFQHPLAINEFFIQ